VIVALNAASLAAKLLQLTSGASYDADRNVHTVHRTKLDELKKLRKKHSKEPLLVFTQVQHEMARVLADNPDAVKFDESLMPQWRAGKIKMMVANSASIGEGIDGLQEGGRIAVWMTPTYSFRRYSQTNARLIRTGQSMETIVYRLIAKGTIDEAATETLRVKDETQDGALLALKHLQMLKG
jgi:hypothetical protein